MALHARLNEPSPLCDLLEAVQPLSGAAPRQVKIELVACPSTKCSGHQDPQGIETAHMRHHDGSGVHNLAFDYRCNENAQIRQDMHEIDQRPIFKNRGQTGEFPFFQFNEVLDRKKGNSPV